MLQGLDIKYKSVQKIKLLVGLMLFWISWMLPTTIISGILSITYNEITILFYLCLGFFLGVTLLVIVLVLWWINRYYESFQFELLDEGILIREGVITKNERHIPYGRIQNLNIIRGFIQRRYGIATLMIETAGSAAVAKSPSMTAEGMIPGIRDPEPLIQQILPKLGYKREGIIMGSSTEEKGEELAVLKEINANLKDIRKLIEKRN
jgi:membrane protein YdbS with pleckstrin-like domain